MAKPQDEWMKLDVHSIQDPDIQLMLTDKGEAAVLEYYIMCALMNDCERFDYAIPEKLFPYMANLLHTTEDKIRDTVRYCIGNGFFILEEDDLGEKRVYSERRRVELHEKDLARRTMSEAGKRGNEKRWNKRRDNDNN